MAFWATDANGSNADAGIGEVDAGVLASREMTVKKKRAMETLFVECVEGKPYSRW